VRAKKEGERKEKFVGADLPLFDGFRKRRVRLVPLTQPRQKYPATQIRGISLECSQIAQYLG
jgi:hypothetical protein